MDDPGTCTGLARLRTLALFYQSTLDGSWVISSAILLVGELLPLTRSGMWAVGIVGDIVACLAVLQMYALFKFRSALSLGPSPTTAHHCQ